MAERDSVYRERKKRQREWWLAATLLLVFAALTALEFKLTRISTALPFVNSIFFFGLLNLNLIILIAVVWLVARNVGKLFIERRRNVLGSRLKTKLVVSFLSFSIIPTLVLFLISALYINSSFDKWFSIKIQNTLQASLEITRAYYTNSERTATHFAEHLSNGVARKLEGGAPDRFEAQAGRQGWLQSHLETQRELLALDAVEFYSDSLEERILVVRPGAADLGAGFPRLAIDSLEQAFRGKVFSQVDSIGTGDLIRALYPVRVLGKVRGVIAVSSAIPVSLVSKVGEISGVFEDYKGTNPLKYPVKTAYLVILIMITLVILFVAIWVGLFMARELTIPVEKLVKGARAVGGGDLDVQVQEAGHDEIAVLIRSFNAMTRDLRQSRERLTEASRDIEKRRAQLEAVLANVGTGVLVAESSGEIRTFNRALSQILGWESGRVLGRSFQEVFQSESTQPIREVMGLALSGSPSGTGDAEVTQWNYRDGDAVRSLACVATALRDSQESSDSKPWGVVAVVDDMTHLVKAQREVAWREVARRIAHEIKNPLTPIKLSAQRLQRRLAGLTGSDGALVQECSGLIIQHVDELKEMVNEFSSFARFPEINPSRNSINQVVTETLGLYRQAHPSIRFDTLLDERLEPFDFDRDQLKRVLINLIENAVAALNGVSESRRQIRFETEALADIRFARLKVTDTGVGMDEETLSRVFEPYFSTRHEGTGLGLAIAKRIINDHDGFIRVSSRQGEGTTFQIELPTSGLGAPEHSRGDLS
jgi:two-component system nitrogen regulation sensor histidine kinase NtrY